MSFQDATARKSGLNFSFEHVRLEAIVGVRRNHLAQLPVAADTRLDRQLLQDAEGVAIRLKDEVVAYALVQRNPDGFLPAPLLVGLGAPELGGLELRALFHDLVKREGIKAVWGRSDDARLLEVLLLEGWKLSAAGTLIVQEEVAATEEDERLEIRHLHLDALEDVLAFSQRISAEEGGGRSREELRQLLHLRVLDGLFMEGKLVALSHLLGSTHPEYLDLWIMVDPSHRRQGLGRFLAATVAAEEIAAGRSLLAAFTPHEVPARRLLESLGARVLSTFYVARP